MREVGLARNDSLARSHADCGAVAHFWRALRSAVNLLQHRVIYFGSKNILDRVRVGPVSICRELHAIRQTIFKSEKKMKRAARVTLIDEPAWNKFGIRVEGNPRPNIASAVFWLD